MFIGNGVTPFNTRLKGGLTGIDKIFSDDGYINLWASEKNSISGTSTTLIDYGGEHNLTNPAAANQPTFNSSDANFNNLPSLDFDGTTDYLYKAYDDYRIGDNSGAFTFTFRTPSSYSTNTAIWCAADEASNTEKIVIYIDNTGKLTCIVNYGGTNNRMVYIDALTVDTEYTAYLGSTGSAYFMGLNGAAEAFQVNLGADDGKWFNDLTTLTNITFGARISTASLFYDDTIVQVGYLPYVSTAQINAASLNMKNHYGI